MENNIAIRVKNLTKIYKLYNAPIDRLKEALHWRGKKYHKNFYALSDVSFEIKQGECIGIIGKNGAGKSTILKIITGVLTQTSGSVTVNGRVAALLELGAGFNPEYTGIENIYFQSSLMGYAKEDVDTKIQEIISFADIGEFIHQPVKSYSSGMFARLAFAVAINVEPDILIVDEALSVGDMFFQAKSMAKMKQLIKNDKTTVLFVSHDIASIKAMCSRAILLENSRVKSIGDASAVADEYFASRFYQPKVEESQALRIKPQILPENPPDKAFVYSNVEFTKTSKFQRVQNGKANFTNVVLLDEHERQISYANFGQVIILRCLVKSHEDIHNLSFGFHIRDRNGVDLLYDDSVLQQHPIVAVKPDEELIIDWKFKVLLQAGSYIIATVTSIPINLEHSEVDMCDFVPIALQFDVHSRQDKVHAAVFANSSLIIKSA